MCGVVKLSLNVLASVCNFLPQL
uniref:Uncharacterized protein n=1 Tax=Anguilla anguilla TaxID=7936 RepID=A0A0E9VAQ8_ANGAN